MGSVVMPGPDRNSAMSTSAERDDEGEDQRRQHARRHQWQGHFDQHAQSRGAECRRRGFKVGVDAFQARDDASDGERQADQHVTDRESRELGHRKARQHQQ